MLHWSSVSFKQKIINAMCSVLNLQALKITTSYTIFTWNFLTRFLMLILFQIYSKSFLTKDLKCKFIKLHFIPNTMRPCVLTNGFKDSVTITHKSNAFFINMCSFYLNLEILRSEFSIFWKSLKKRDLKCFILNLHFFRK